MPEEQLAAFTDASDTLSGSGCMTSSGDSSLDRRMLLKGGGALIGVTCAFSGALARTARPRPLAITDITVRRELLADFPGTIGALRKIGYTHFGSRLRRYVPTERPELPAAEKARILRDAGMKIGVVRLTTPRPDALPGDSIAAQIADARLLGAKIVAAPPAHVFLAVTGSGYAMHVPTPDELVVYIKELDALGRQVADQGMRLAYHNHDFDATEVGGVRALDRMIDTSDPRYVSFELDLAWAWLAGYEPLALAKRLGRRLVSLHVKDVDRKHGSSPMAQMVAPGEGEMDFAAWLPKLAAMTDALMGIEVDLARDGIATATRAWSFVERTLGYATAVAPRGA